MNDCSSQSSWLVSFKNFSAERNFYEPDIFSKLVKISVREILFLGVLKICQKSENIE